ncbi:EF hand [Sulfitobacter brevis]|uniref:EF hand n=1 Tax=Sulfitobacter brevis TaxID=74348 RepID=A0A1I2G858_9RHOB|nr:calcium-binding protein [Sulfitobacter brevis]SFF13398.1 EF hand [Sulfitobacter brevis]
MNRRIILAATVLAATAIGSVAFADSNHGHQGQPRSNDRQGMMMQDRGPGMMDMMQRLHGNMMGGGMMQMFDADGDGTVTPEELRTQLQAKLAEYDGNGDGSLSITEFEILHSAMIREAMVDRFQYLDANGDGAITAEEMTAPATKMERMNMMRAGQGQMQGQPGSGQVMGNGTMMNDN